MMGLELEHRMSHLGQSSYHVQATYKQPNIELEGVKPVKIVHISQNKIKLKQRRKSFCYFFILKKNLKEKMCKGPYPDTWQN